MAMISKTVSGSAEEYKYIKNGKSYPKSSASGTQRTSFTGSSDSRPAGPTNANMTLLDAPGLIDDGPVTSATQNEKQPHLALVLVKEKSGRLETIATAYVNNMILKLERKL